MTHKNHFIISCFGSLALLTFAACADDDLGTGNDGDKDTHVSFIVSQAQDNAQDNTTNGHNAQAAAVKAMPGTRALFAHQLALQGLTPEDLTTQKLPVQGATDMCLIETTTAGIDNPIQHRTNAATRANVKGEGTNLFDTNDHFATIGYRGTSAASVATIASTPWFHDADTKADGVLVNPIRWSWFQPWGKFYGVYPRPAEYSGITLSTNSYTFTPYADFTVEQNVRDQKDMMVACSGNVHYITQGTAPETNLDFLHTLTAVRFKVGQNLSWNKTITKIEIIGAKSKGRYTFPTDRFTSPSVYAKGTWSGLSTPTTFTLGGLNVSTSEAVNNIIVGKNNDNFTFYMIPQTLTGVSIKVYFSDGSTPISANLTGTWKAGTTKVYALSQITSNWNYVLNVTGPTTPVAYNQTNAGNYTIQSYRQSGGTQQPVKWKVVGYQESSDGGSTWSTLSDTKPAWLTSLSLESGDGSTSNEYGNATVQKAQLFDKLAAYNKVLHDATPKGSAGNYYNLSNHTGAAPVENTANSYLISAPGYYKIPLVYGNAIKNGSNNPSSYQTSNTGTYILTHFKDHADVDIDNPWITQTNSGANVPDGAKIVWTDQSGIVETSSIGLEGSGTNAFVHFRVPQDKIKNGNAVIAVTKGGTVVWSWHLWFAKDEELNTIPMVNFQNKTYSFTKQTLGFAYRKWEASTYTQPRVARIKVEQTMTNGGVKQFGYIDITQNPGSVKEFGSTYYQFGRKDAMPGTDAIAEGSFNKNAGDNMSIQNGIQHPENFYTDGNSWTSNPPVGYSYYNLWSMDNTTTLYNDNAVAKTIYDPCPVGLKMPASNAFSGFTQNGQNGGTPNIEGSWDMGYTFKSKSGTNTVFFPASGFRYYIDGSLINVGNFGLYWSAVPYDTHSDCILIFGSGFVNPLSYYVRSYGLAVRPVSE